MPDLTPAAEAFIGGCILSRTCHWPTNDSGDEVENATLDQWASVYHSPTCIQTRQRRREALATPVAPAPNSAPNMPEAGERCAWRGVGTGTCGSVKEHPRHSHRGGDACEDESGECSRDFAYCHPFQPEPAP